MEQKTTGQLNKAEQKEKLRQEREKVREREKARQKRKAAAARRRRRRRNIPFSEALRDFWTGIRQGLRIQRHRLRRRFRRLTHDARHDRHPESNNLLVRVILLVIGLMPMWASLTRERLSGRRRERIKRSERYTATLDRYFKKVHPLKYMLAAGVLAAIVLVLSIYTIGVTVTYDGKVLARLHDGSTAEEAEEKIEKAVSRALGSEFTLDPELLKHERGILRRREIEKDGSAYAQALSAELDLVKQVYCLYINGEFLAATPYEGALEELLEQLQEAASDENTASCSFAEEVEIKPEYRSGEAIRNLGYIAELLYSTKEAEVTYEVKKGDTWSQIAAAHGLTSKQLEALNPGFNINRLSIGEELLLSASVPYLTMTVVQQERYVEDQMFDIIYTDSKDIWQGEYKVTSKGEYGKADVVATATYVNGEETERTYLSRVTLTEPVTEYRLRGTKVRPSWAPTGSFRWPCSGRITSRFGRRSSPGGIGSTNHKGIDIAAPKGTPVYAADGGTVTYAGWQGGYGYMVEISHSNGLKTRYAHNSSLLVKRGQNVYKGQQIARVGSTGNSTGPHCHFEVLYNGVNRNPMNYLP